MEVLQALFDGIPDGFKEELKVPGRIKSNLVLEFFSTAGIFGSSIEVDGVWINQTEDLEVWCPVASMESGHRPMEGNESELRILKSAIEC